MNKKEIIKDAMHHMQNVNGRETPQELFRLGIEACIDVLGEDKKELPNDKQVGGDHYKNKAIQPIDYIFANNLGFCEGNVVKYVTRHKEKNGLQDLEKAKHYLELLISQIESKQKEIV